MKKLTLLLFLVFSSTCIFSQINIDATILTSKTELSDVQKTIAKEKAQYIINTYAANAGMRGMTERQKYFRLFQDNAKIWNDIEAKPESTTLTLDDLDYIAGDLEGNGGHIFKISNVKISDAYVEFGDLRVVLSFDKEIENYLNTEYLVTRYDTPVKAEMNVTFRISSGQTDRVRIYKIDGKYIEGKKNIVAKEDKAEIIAIRAKQDNNISLGVSKGLLGGMGSTLNVNNTDEIGFSEPLNSSYIENLGLYLNYRKGIFSGGAKPKIYLTIGAKYLNASIDTDVSSYNASFEGDQIATAITIIDKNVINTESVDGKIILESISDDAKEKLSINSLQINIGAEYKVMSSNTGGIFLGLSGGVNFLSGGTGEVEGDLTFIEIPNSEDGTPFPDITDSIYGSIINQYQTKLEDNIASGIKPASNMSFFITPSIRYQMIISQRIGFELGLNYELGISNYFSAESYNDENQFLSNIGNQQKTRVNTVLEDYVSSTKMNGLSARLGLVYLLN